MQYGGRKLLQVKQAVISAVARKHPQGQPCTGCSQPTVCSYYDSERKVWLCPECLDRIRKESETRGVLLARSAVNGTWHLAALAASFVLLSSTSCSEASLDGPVPGVERVVLISIDSLRPDFVNPYNPKSVASPEIAVLASEGSLFRDVLSQASSTARSHKSIFYSLYPAIHKTSLGSSPEERLQSPLETLQEAAYLTAAMVGGGQLHPQYGFGKGFDSYELARTEKGTQALSVLEKKALDWLRENAQKRFFLFLHTYQMHAPYTPPEKYWREYAGWYRGTLDPRAVHFNKASLGEEEIRFLRDLYAAQLAYVDSFLGRLLQNLRDLEIYETTMIVLLSDHGESLGERGQFGHNHLNDVHIRVPLIIRIPGVAPSEVNQPVETIDVMPTIFAVLGLRPPFSFQGKSLLPLMRGASENWKTEYRIAQEGRRVAVQKGTWKLIFRLNRTRAGRLYNLAADPNEKDNVAAAFPEMVAEFKEYYRQRMAEAGELKSSFVVTKTRNPTRDEEVRRQLKALGYLE